MPQITEHGITFAQEVKVHGRPHDKSRYQDIEQYSPRSLVETRLDIYVNRRLIVEPHAVAVGALDMQPVQSRTKTGELYGVGALKIVPLLVVIEPVGILEKIFIGKIQCCETYGEIAPVDIHVDAVGVEYMVLLRLTPETAHL